MARLKDAGLMTLYYTATGTAGEQVPTYKQRIFEASAMLATGEAMPRLENWTDNGEPIQADGALYRVAGQTHGEPGFIEAFRDPFYFADAESGKEQLLFSASSAKAETERNGAIGIATASRSTGRWELREPLIRADGVTSEMERPHVVRHEGGYYLFWSTHGWTFADDIEAPTGLYGMVGESLHGPYEPINGSGLVAANPIGRPYQTYSWWVSNDLGVSSFVDMPNGSIDPAPGSPRYPIGRFEGTIAPEFHLRLDGARAWIGSPAELMPGI